MKEHADLVKGMKTALCRTQLQLGLLWQARVKRDKEEFAKLLNVEDIEEEEAELDSSISNPPDEP